MMASILIGSSENNFCSGLNLCKIEGSNMIFNSLTFARSRGRVLKTEGKVVENQSRTNGPINAHLTIAQV